MDAKPYPNYVCLSVALVFIIKAGKKKNISQVNTYIFKTMGRKT